MPPVSRQRPAEILFVTGTDTGVGKTLLTALLLIHLRSKGVTALGIKPFCSGGRGDVHLLRAAQDHALTEDEINPFYFRAPVAPLVAQRDRQETVRPGQVLRHVRMIASRCDVLLVEGAGGVLAPLGEGFSLAGMIASASDEVNRVLVVAPNKLGVINHALLTLASLQQICPKRVTISLMGQKHSDISARTNAEMLRELAVSTEVIEVPFLAGDLRQVSRLKENCRKNEKVLARLSASGSFRVAIGDEGGGRGGERRKGIDNCRRRT
jgi:dethiobiotin synthetase